MLLHFMFFCIHYILQEISIGIIGNLACHEVPMKRIVSTKGLIEMIVDKLFLDDPQCLSETSRYDASLTHVDVVILTFIFVRGQVT